MFQGILGHTREIEILKGSAASGRLSHAFLFAGPDGVGKRLVAKAFAASLNCREGGTDACGSCPDCSMAASSTHPGIIEVWPTDKDGERDPAGLIRIEEVRSVQGALKYMVERGRKIVIVDGAERLMPAAANAFLKTLEEPPEATVIILVSSKASELLPTIISRCHRINFRPLPDDAVRHYLIESRGVAPAEAGAVARLSGGSIARAAAYMEEGAHKRRKEVVERLTRLGPGDFDEALKYAEELSKDDDLDGLLEFLKSWYRDRIVAFEGAPHLIVNTDLAKQVKDAGIEDFNALCSSFWAIEEARRSMAPPRYANRQLTMEVLVLKLSGAHFM